MKHMSTSAGSEAAIANAKRKLKRAQALRCFYRIKIKTGLFTPVKHVYSLTIPSLEKNTLKYDDPKTGIITLTLVPNSVVSIAIPEAEGSREQILKDYFQYAKFV